MSYHDDATCEEIAPSLTHHYLPSPVIAVNDVVSVPLFRARADTRLEASASAPPTPRPLPPAPSPAPPPTPEAEAERENKGDNERKSEGEGEGAGTAGPPLPTAFAAVNPIKPLLNETLHALLVGLLRYSYCHAEIDGESARCWESGMAWHEAGPEVESDDEEEPGDAHFETKRDDAWRDPAATASDAGAGGRAWREGERAAGGDGRVSASDFAGNWFVRVLGDGTLALVHVPPVEQWAAAVEAAESSSPGQAVSGLVRVMVSTLPLLDARLAGFVAGGVAGGVAGDAPGGVSGGVAGGESPAPSSTIPQGEMPYEVADGPGAQMAAKAGRYWLEQTQRAVARLHARAYATAAFHLVRAGVDVSPHDLTQALALNDKVGGCEHPIPKRLRGPAAPPSRPPPPPPPPPSNYRPTTRPGRAAQGRRSGDWSRAGCDTARTDLCASARGSR